MANSLWNNNLEFIIQGRPNTEACWNTARPQNCWHYNESVYSLTSSKHRKPKCMERFSSWIVRPACGSDNRKITSASILQNTSFPHHPPHYIKLWNQFSVDQRQTYWWMLLSGEPVTAFHSGTICLDGQLQEVPSRCSGTFMKGSPLFKFSISKPDISLATDSHTLQLLCPK